MFYVESYIRTITTKTSTTVIVSSVVWPIEVQYATMTSLSRSNHGWCIPGTSYPHLIPSRRRSSPSFSCSYPNTSCWRRPLKSWGYQDILAQRSGIHSRSTAELLLSPTSFFSPSDPCLYYWPWSGAWMKGMQMAPQAMQTTWSCSMTASFLRDPHELTSSPFFRARRADAGWLITS